MGNSNAKVRASSLVVDATDSSKRKLNESFDTSTSDKMATPPEAVPLQMSTRKQAVINRVFFVPDYLFHVRKYLGVTADAPLRFLCRSSNKWLKKENNTYSSKDRGSYCSSLNLMKWAIDILKIPIDAVMSEVAISNGDLDSVKWIKEKLLKKFKEEDLAGYMWDETCMNCAASRGDMKIITYLRSDEHCFKCPWSHLTVQIAVENGKIDSFDYLLNNGCPVVPKNLFIAAIENNQLEILKHICLKYSVLWDQTKTNEELTRICCEKNYLCMLQWLCEQGCRITESSCRSAAYEGNLDVLIYARSQGASWDAMTCAFAAQNGQLHIVKYMRSLPQGEKCPWDSWTCMTSALSGHIELLKYVRSLDPPAPWNIDIIKKVITQGQHDIARWMINQDVIFAQFLDRDGNLYNPDINNS